MPVQGSFQVIKPPGDDDVGIEVIDPLGAELLGDVLKGRALGRGAQLDDSVPEDPPRQLTNRQFLDVDDRIESGRCLGGAVRSSSDSTQ